MNDCELQTLRKNKLVLLYLTRVSVWLCIAPRKVITSAFIEHIWFFVKSAQKIFDINMTIQDAHINSAIRSSSEFTKNDVFIMFNVHTFGLDPHVTKTQWAYPLWYIIHAAAIVVSSKKDLIDLLHSVVHIIPCGICSQHMDDFMIQNDISKVPIDQLFSYTSNLHQQSKSLQYLTPSDNMELKKMYNDLVPLYHKTAQILTTKRTTMQ